MNIIDVVKRPNSELDKRLSKRYLCLEKMISELGSREIPSEILAELNAGIKETNAYDGTNNQLNLKLMRLQYRILKKLEKQLKLVPVNYYKNMWLGLGMAVFGIPMGVAFSSSLGNMSFIGIGLPIGMVLGMAYGSKLDKKAAEKGNQMNFEMK